MPSTTRVRRSSGRLSTRSSNPSFYARDRYRPGRSPLRGQCRVCRPGDEELRFLPPGFDRSLPARGGGERAGLPCAGRTESGGALHHRGCLCPLQYRDRHDGDGQQVGLPCDADAVLFPKGAPRADRGCGRTHLDPLRAGELGAEQRGGEAERHDLHDPDGGGVPDPEPLARGGGGLLRALKPPAPGVFPCVKERPRIPVPARGPVPRRGPPPAVQAREHVDPPPPGSRAVQPHDPRGEHPPRAPAPERVAHRPFLTGPGPDRREEP
jgi:hypothetical protein